MNVGKRDAKAGAVLLEVLIGLAVMGMLAVATTAAISSIGRALAQSERVDAVLEEHLYRNRFSRAVSAMPSRQEADQSLTGTGTELSLWVVGLDGAASIRELRLSATTGGIELAAPPADDLPSVSWILDRTGRDLSLRYWGDPDRVGTMGWHPAWSQPFLPRLIRADWTRADGRAAPPLIIEPARDAVYRTISLSSPVPPR